MHFDIMTDKRLTLEAGATIVENAILCKKPLSLIRIGEGEATFLQDSSHWTANLIGWRQKYYFGTDDIPLQHWFQLCEDIRNALSCSDLFCCPSPERISACQQSNMFGERYRAIQQLCADFDFSQNTKLLGNTYIGYGLHSSGKIYQWLEMASNVLIVTSQPIIANLKLLFPGKVKHIKVPPRAIDNEKLEDTNHFPDEYYSIINQISHIEPGTLALIGAGPCGKVYCDKVKQAGGIAIDIGALFDAWCGHVTRPNMQVADGFYNHHVLPANVAAKQQCVPSFLLTTDNIYQTTGGKVDKRGVELEKFSPKLSPCYAHDKVLFCGQQGNQPPDTMTSVSIPKNKSQAKIIDSNDQYLKLDKMYSSLLWRLSAPIRKIIACLSKCRQGANNRK